MKTKNVKQIFLFIIISIIGAPQSMAGLGFWSSHGPDGGQVYDIVADPITPNSFYVTTRGGVYKSIDGGINWQIVNNGITANFVLRIAHHPSVSGVVYVISNSSVFKTTDAGLNWSVSNTGLPANDRFSSIEIAPLTSDILYLGTANNGVFKSTNAGLSWSPANIGLMTTVEALKISPLDSNRVYAAVSGALSGLYESTDGGVTWTDVSPSIPAPFTLGDPVTNIEFAGFAGELYLTTYSGVYKSSDNGTTWTHSSSFFGNEIAVNPSNSNEVIISGSVGVWLTTDGGINWSQALVDFIGNNNEVSESSVVIYNPFNPTIKLAGTTSNGVYRQSSSSPQWVAQVAGMNAENIRGLAVANYPDTSSRVFAGVGDVFSPSHVSFISDDQGLSWSQNNSGLNALNFREIEVDPFTTTDRVNTHVYAVGRDTVTTTITGGLSDADGGIYKSINGGTTWMTIDNGIPLSMGPPVLSLFGTVRDISLDLSSSVGGGPAQVLYAAGSGKFTSGGMGPASTLASRIYKSIDAGATWFASDAGIAIPESTEIFPFPAAVKIVVDQSNSLNLYAATFLFGYNSASPSPTIENGVWKSTDAGTTWKHASVGLPVVGVSGTSNHSVLSLAIDPTNSSRLYASVHDPDTTESQIYKSEDSALTWSVANTGIATSDVRDILVASNGDVYAAAAGNSGNPGGVYRSQDFGATWQSMNVGLDSIVSVTQLDIDETTSNTLVYAGTEQSVHSFEIVPDGDTDGVPDITESNAPNSGDGNNDGTNDSAQNHVSSLPVIPIDTDQIRSPSGVSDYVTIDVASISGVCNTLEDVQALTGTDIPDDLNRSFDFGVVRFELVDCEQAVVTITYHGAPEFLNPSWGYRTFAPLVSGDTEFFWQDMSANVNGNSWTLNLLDGQFGDIRPNNGRILFQGGPGNYDNSIFLDSFE